MALKARDGSGVVSTDGAKTADKGTDRGTARRLGRKAAERNASESNADPVLAHVGQQVLAARQRLGLTQEQLAEKAGCAAATVFLVENARRNATIRSLSILAGALGVDVADLFPRSRAASSKPRSSGSAAAIADEVSRVREALGRIDRLVHEVDDSDEEQG